MNYGGKGNSILLLKKNGFSVPQTILFDLNEIHTFLLNNIPAYSRLMADIALWQTSADAPESLKILREKILQLTMPPGWSALYQKVRLIGSTIILRSSMSIEDHECASFAGCFDSFVINEVTEENLWNNVQKILLSAFNPSSILRMLGEGFPLNRLQVGFFIQQWIPAKLAGVVFSRNPNFLWEKNGVVEWGTSGETVVQGTGNVNTANQSDPSPKALLPLWNQLWSSVEKLEKCLQGPIDVEWVWDGQKLWIVQLRLVASEEAQVVRRTPNGRRWTREQVLERFPEPLTPLGFTALEDFFTTNLRILDNEFGIIVKNSTDAILAYGGYVYANPDLFRFPKIRLRLSHYFAPWKKCFWRFLQVAVTFLYQKIAGKQSLVSIHKIKLLHAMFEEKTEKQIATWDTHREVHLKLIENFQIKLQTLQSFTQGQILDAMEELKILSRNFMEPDFSVYFLKDVYFKGLQSLSSEVKLSDLEFIDLVGCFDHNRTSQMRLEWEELIAALNRDPGYLRFIESLQSNVMNAEDAAQLYLQSDTHQLWQDFFNKNGHIRTSWDLARPCWREEPEKLVFILQEFFKNNRNTQNHAHHKRDIVLAKLFKEVQKRGEQHAVPLINKTLSHLANLMKIDEEQHFLSGILFEPSRKLALHAEQIFLQQGLLQEKGQIFFLTLAEIKEQLRNSTMNLNFLAKRRQSQWERNKANPTPMELSQNMQCQNTPSENVDSLCGYPVSPGVATGPIHYIEHLEDTRDMPSGAIMLTTSPNPTFAPIYPILAGMITVTGGPLSHGFVAARESGLPAISGICEALQKFKPGMIVKLNGYTGSVEILEYNQQS